MQFRAHVEVEAAFRPVERRLDELLEKVRERLEQRALSVRDVSNRTGFDGGFSTFIWAFDFEKEADYQNEIKRATVRLWYREPPLEGLPQTIEVTSVAEIFRTGEESRVYKATEVVYSIEEFLQMPLEQVIIERLAVAEQLIADL